MPRTWRPAAAPVLIAVLCATVPPALLHGALAAAAGTLFEAAPFVLATELFPHARFAALVEPLGCGCGRRTPGALSAAATGLTWLAFGPAVAAARFGAALVLAARRRALTSAPGGHAERDPLAELAALAPWALLAGLAAQVAAVLRPEMVPLRWFATLPPAARALAELAAGGALGVLAPCTTAGVAVAASLAGPAPPVAWGLLATCGLVPRPPWPGRVAPAPATVSYAVLALALGTLAIRGTGGFVNPRLRAPEGAAALLASVAAVRGSRSGRMTLGVPVALVAALATGSPPPPYRADPTRIADAFPGERLRFLGVVETASGATSLERYTITCCRVDAGLVAVRLDRRLRNVRDGVWVEADGTLARSPSGELVLRPAMWQPVAAPRDPFAYR